MDSVARFFRKVRVLFGREKFGVERIECGCGLAVDVKRAHKILVLMQANHQQRNRQTRVDP